MENCMRGSADIKGPSIAAYYVMRIIKDLELPISKIRFIFGTDEESEMVGIHRYMEVEEMPKVGFSPDAQFWLMVKRNLVLWSNFRA